MKNIKLFFLIELKKQTSEKTSKEFKDILNHGFIQELELLTLIAHKCYFCLIKMLFICYNDEN